MKIDSFIPVPDDRLSPDVFLEITVSCIGKPDFPWSFFFYLDARCAALLMYRIASHRSPFCPMSIKER